MHALKLLEADHERLLDLANQLTGGAGDPSGSPKERRRIALELIALGSTHEAVEEQYLWPAVRRLTGGAPLALAGLGQETTLKNHLHELERMRAGNVHFGTAVYSIESHLRDHATYEQNQIFPKLQLALGDRALEALGAEIEEARAQAPTRPHPHTPPDADLLRTVGPLIGKVDRVLDRVVGRPHP